MDSPYANKPAPRWSVLAPVVPRTSELRPQWSTVNISATGMFVTGMPLLRPGSVVEVDVVLGPSLGISSRVEVVWTRGQPDASRNRPAGMGMRFIGIDERAQAELTAHLAELSTRQNSVPAQLPTPVGDMAPPPPPLAARAVKKGDQLGRYTVIDRLGAGGMGDVYLAEHTLLGRRVALKLLKEKFVHDRTALRRLHDEARLVNQVAHDNIVQITDIGVEEQHVFIVMELLVGQNLSELLLRGGPMPLSRIVGIGLQLCSVLDAVHRAGIVHRDLKPQNIMLVRHVMTHDFVKLVDFGIAQLRNGVQADGPQLVGEVVGSPGYTAPEQLTGGPVDARSDIYSLGCVLFAMLTAQLPFKGSGWAEMVVRQMQDAPRAPSAVVGQRVPRVLDELVVRCLDRDPKRRPAVAEITEVLTHFAGDPSRAQ